MEGNGYHHNGPANGDSTRNGSGLAGPRIMTIEEALPYSPFTSVVPFNSGDSLLFNYLAPTNIEADIIPLPRVGLRSSVPIFANSQEREEARRGLEVLNQEAREPQSTSQKLQDSLNELKELLKPEGITRLYASSYSSLLW